VFASVECRESKGKYGRGKKKSDEKWKRKKLKRYTI
jgi:hypothetical protein